jgi:hypothetical protein
VDKGGGRHGHGIPASWLDRFVAHQTDHVSRGNSPVAANSARISAILRFGVPLRRPPVFLPIAICLRNAGLSLLQILSRPSIFVYVRRASLSGSSRPVKAGLLQIENS